MAFFQIKYTLTYNTTKIQLTRALWSLNYDSLKMNYEAIPMLGN